MADAQQQAAQTSAAMADDMSTPRVDERREALSEASAHTDRAAANPGAATALLAQADTGPAASRRRRRRDDPQPELRDADQGGGPGTGRAQADGRGGAHRPHGRQGRHDNWASPLTTAATVEGS